MVQKFIGFVKEHVCTGTRLRLGGGGVGRHVDAGWTTVDDCSLKKLSEDVQRNIRPFIPMEAHSRPGIQDPGSGVQGPESGIRVVLAFAQVQDTEDDSSSGHGQDIIPVQDTVRPRFQFKTRFQFGTRSGHNSSSRGESSSGHSQTTISVQDTIPVRGHDSSSRHDSSSGHGHDTILVQFLSLIHI